MTTTQQKTYWQFGALQSAAGGKKGRNEQLFKQCHYLLINISDNSVFIDEKDSKYSILLLIGQFQKYSGKQQSTIEQHFIFTILFFF